MTTDEALWFVTMLFRFNFNDVRFGNLQRWVLTTHRDFWTTSPLITNDAMTKAMYLWIAIDQRLLRTDDDRLECLTAQDWLNIIDIDTVMQETALYMTASNIGLDGLVIPDGVIPRIEKWQLVKWLKKFIPIK